MAVRTVWTGDAPAQVPHYYGTFSEIVAITGPNGAIGHPTDSKELLEYEDGEWGSIGATSKFPPAPGSPSAPFASVAELPATGAFVGDIKYLVSPNVPCGMVRREWCNSVWQTPAGETILQKSNPLSLLNPGNTDAVALPIATIPINSVVDGDWEMILGYEQGAANTGTDNLGLDVNGVNLFSTGNIVSGAAPQLWSHHLRFVRMGTAIRIFYYQRLGGFVAAISGITIDFSVAVNLSWRAQPGNGANNLYLRNVALKRVN